MAKKISAALHAQLTEKLEQLLDQADDVAAKKKKITDAIKGQQKKIALGVSQTRRRLKGLDLEQAEIPGTEVAEIGIDPVVEEILQRAGALQIMKDPPPGGGELQWVSADGEHTAEPEDGLVYRVAATVDDNGWWGTERSIDYGDTWKRLGFGSPDLEAAKRHCARDFLERQADATLKNAGDGELTKKDMKGGAAKRKGSRR